MGWRNFGSRVCACFFLFCFFVLMLIPSAIFLLPFFFLLVSPRTHIVITWSSFGHSLPLRRTPLRLDRGVHPDMFIFWASFLSTRATIKVYLFLAKMVSEWRARLLNPFTTGIPFLGTKLLRFSIGRGSGAPKIVQNRPFLGAWFLLCTSSPWHFFSGVVLAAVLIFLLQISSWGERS